MDFCTVDGLEWVGHLTPFIEAVHCRLGWVYRVDFCTVDGLEWVVHLTPHSLKRCTAGWGGFTGWTSALLMAWSG